MPRLRSRRRCTAPKFIAHLPHSPRTHRARSTGSPSARLCSPSGASWACPIFVCYVSSLGDRLSGALAVVVGDVTPLVSHPYGIL